MPRDPDTEVVSHAYASQLAWLDCLIERETLRLRAGYELSADELRGLYISDRQVDALLQSAAGDFDPAVRLIERAQRLRATWLPSHLVALARRFDLGDLELEIVMLALAPEVDTRYEVHYAYLNNDAACKFATVDLARRLLREPTAVRRALSPASALIARGLLELMDPESCRSSLQRAFSLAPLLAQFLLDLPLVDARWGPLVRWLPPAHAYDDEGLPVDGAAVFVCVGDDPDRLRGRAQAIADARRWPLLAAPLSSLCGDAATVRTLAQRLALAVALVDGALLLHDADDPALPDNAQLRTAREAVRVLCDEVPVILAVSSRGPWAMGIGDVAALRVEHPTPDLAERAAQWRTAVRAAGLPDDVAACEELAAKFRMPVARIDAASRAVALLPRDARATPERMRLQLLTAARRASDQALADLATRVTRPVTFDDLVVPDGLLRQLRDIAGAIAQRDRVFHTWGLIDRAGGSGGLFVLFAGASGTGKTMAASVIANAVGLDLYRVDLGAVVSKYIGETERNLDRIFEAARGANAIVLVDEADALLGKRSEVSDAHDRYANIEVAYLLSKLEEHDGVVILSSNLPKNLDPAFARRMHYSLEFARPNAQLRERLWRGMFPAAAPLADDVDFRFLAETFDTTGGEIAAVALDAAFVASAQGGSIRMEHLVRAMARRQTKQGNPGGYERFNEHKKQASAHSATR